MQNSFFQLRVMVILLVVISSCNKNTSPTPDPPAESIYVNCVPELTDASFDIVTWNIEHFPATDFQVEQVVDIIKTLDADLIALQEIANQEALDQLTISGGVSWQ